MGMAAILFNVPGPFEQIVNTRLTEGSVLISAENCSNDFREEDIKNYTNFYMYIAEEQG